MRSGIRLTKDPHFAALEKMYLAAPINAFYRPKNEVSDSEASACHINSTNSLHCTHVGVDRVG